jgi:tripartite-type tricarboxylate transporter receptor subunit TctC
MRRFVAAVLTCALPAALATAHPASAAEDFYKGKQITFVASGQGVYEGYARAIAKYMPKYIPGNPNIIVQLMTGAAGLQAANHVYNTAPQDGTVVAATHGHIPTAPQLNPNGARFDPNKFHWIGNATKDVFIGYVWHTAPAQSMEQAKTIELKMGGQAVGSMSIDMAILAKEMFGLKFKIITGYSGSQETKLAVEKGETDGHFGNAWTSIKTSNPEWLRDKKITIITQFGFKRHRDLPDVPLFIDLSKTAEDRQVLELMLARQETSKPYYMGPGVPADRVAILRAAFDKVMVDPEYLAECQRLGYDVEEPMNGQEVADLVARIQKTPPSVAERLLGYFDKFRKG